MAVSFYVLSDGTPDAHWRQACRLAEQAVDQGQRVFVRVDSNDDAKRMDDLLWTFGDRSFLPHEILAPQANAPSHPGMRVLIGHNAPTDFRDLVINLGSDALLDSSFPSIAELVPVDDERKRLARARFKVYRDAGLNPATQNL
jgi:DNA polymerase-3 subunit chi